ncbi:MAG: hypothetical protein ACI8XB_000408 [Patiriisocius sp.]|jgi:hypothetical protein
MKINLKKSLGHMSKIWTFLFALALISTGSVYSQEKLVQFSGIIVTGDSLMPVPYAKVIIKESRRGTIADYFGYFSIVVAEGDSLEFASVGFNTSSFVVPDSLNDTRYSYIQILSQSVTELEEVTVTPWPSREAFREAFLNLPPPDDVLNAKDNLAPSQLLVMLETTDSDGYANYKTNTNSFHNELYYAGQAPPINLLNPMAWAEFIQAWRDGKYNLRKKD